jgi:hypothetical protein
VGRTRRTPQTLKQPRHKARRDPDGALYLAADHPALVGGVPVRLMFAEVDGRLVCVRVELGPDFEDTQQPDPVRITTELLRTIPITRLTDDLLVTLAEQARAASAAANLEAMPAEQRRQWKAAAEEWRTQAESTTTKRPGRPRKYGDKHWQEVAEVYNANSGGRSPTRAVTRHFSRKWKTEVSKSTAAKWVAHCRSIGLIQPFD